MFSPLKEVEASCPVMPCTKYQQAGPRVIRFPLMACHPYLDILRTEGAWFSYMVSLCSLIYPVTNAHAILTSITREHKKQEAIYPAAFASAA